MLARFDCSPPDTPHYVARPAERLVLEGYRRWSRGSSPASPNPLADVDALYRDNLGARDIRPAVAALCDFVGTLGLCAKCPLRVFEAGSRHICRDETLVLGLIAALQHGDERTADACLRALACPERCDPVAMAAGTFAFVLKGFERTLVPIPEATIRAVLARTPAIQPVAPAGSTVH